MLFLVPFSLPLLYQYRSGWVKQVLFWNWCNYFFCIYIYKNADCLWTEICWVIEFRILVLTIFYVFYPIFLRSSRETFCFIPLLFCMNHNDLPTKWIFIKESARWSGIHYYDVAFSNRKWPQQKQFSPTFRNIVFCEAKASKGKKNDMLENWNPFLKSLRVFVLVCRKLW